MRIAIAVAAVIGLALAASVAEPLLKAIEYRGMLAEKRGRVVDADNGEGLAGVTVTAIWTSGTYDTGWASSSGGCDAERVVTTDANGYYTIPPVYGAITFERIWWKQWLMRSLGMPPLASDTTGTWFPSSKATCASATRPGSHVPPKPNISQTVVFQHIGIRLRTTRD